MARSRPTYMVPVDAHVFVISLSRTPARRAQLLDSLVRMEIQYDIFPAVDGRLPFEKQDILKYAAVRKQHKLELYHSYSSISDSALHERLRFGCYLSHVHLWQLQTEEESAHLVILEDDVSLAQGFYVELKDRMQKLPDTWDIFYLNSCHTKYGGLLRPGIFQLRGALCTYGYAISLAGARKLLKHTAIRSEKPIDHMLDEAIYTSLLTAYHAHPPLIFPQKVKSTLAYPSLTT